MDEPAKSGPIEIDQDNMAQLFKEAADKLKELDKAAMKRHEKYRYGIYKTSPK